MQSGFGAKALPNPECSEITNSKVILFTTKMTSLKKGLEEENIAYVGIFLDETLGRDYNLTIKTNSTNFHTF